MIEALKTDKGVVRENNQDALSLAVNKKGDKFYILCDGMGGYKGGEVASFECVKFMKTKFMKTNFSSLESCEKWLYQTIMAANKKIRVLAKKHEDLSKMGTTIICLVVTKTFRVYASVGDSRLYAYNKKELIQLSEDQTFANALLKAGYINEIEAQTHPKKSLLLCAIGSNDEDLDIQIREVKAGYNYLLCSDGLYNMLSEKEILKIINDDKDLNFKVESLIEKANNRGGKDNISVILAEESV